MVKSVRFVFMFNLAHVHFRATIRVCWKACMHAIMYCILHTAVARVHVIIWISMFCIIQYSQF